jgi:hypothetical protein
VDCVRRTIVEALKSCSHNGFPVYDYDERMTTLQGQQVVTHRGALLGLMLRSQLLVLLKHREFVAPAQYVANITNCVCQRLREHQTREPKPSH